MVLNIDITPQIEERLREQARAAGKDVQIYAAQLIEQAAAKPSLDEQLAAVRKQFSAMGVSDEELIGDIADAQADYRRNKKTA